MLKVASYCCLKSGENANICILKLFPSARGCCVFVFLVRLLFFCFAILTASRHAYAYAARVVFQNDLNIYNYPLDRREAPAAGVSPAGEGPNIDGRLVPYTRDAMRTKSRIEFIYLYIYLYIYMHQPWSSCAHRNFGPGK